MQAIKDRDFHIHNDQELQEITTVMLQQLGNANPVIRDELIYVTFATFIERGYYRHEKMLSILHSIQNKNYLFYRIGTSHKEEDAVFRRSFSVLLIPPIMEQHRKSPFIPEEHVHKIWDNLKKYMEQEKDHRGYVSEKGWAHTMAHAADALYSLALCSEITREEVLDMLPFIRKQLLIPHPYLFDEEERMVTAVLVMFDKLDDEERVTWLQTLLFERESFSEPSEDIIINNSKHFLRALYFRVLEREREPLLEVLLQLLKQLRLQEAY